MGLYNNGDKLYKIRMVLDLSKIRLYFKQFNEFYQKEHDLEQNCLCCVSAKQANVLDL